MKKLPYKSTPVKQVITIGNEKIGELEIPKLFGLTPNETDLIEALNLPDDLKGLAELAKKIVRESNKVKLSFVTVYNQLRKFVGDGGFDGVDESKASFLETCLDEVTAFQKQYFKNRNKAFYARALAVLNSRLGMDCTLDDLENPAVIHPSLALELALFGSREEAGMAEDEKVETKPEPDQEVTEELLGESSAA